MFAAEGEKKEGSRQKWSPGYRRISSLIQSVHWCFQLLSFNHRLHGRKELWPQQEPCVTDMQVRTAVHTDLLYPPPGVTLTLYLDHTTRYDFNSSHNFVAVSRFKRLFELFIIFIALPVFISPFFITRSVCLGHVVLEDDKSVISPISSDSSHLFSLHLSLLSQYRYLPNILHVHSPNPLHHKR